MCPAWQTKHSDVCASECFLFVYLKRGYMDKFVEEFKQLYKIDYGRAYDFALQLVLEHPGLVHEIIEYLLRESPKSTTIFHDLFS